MRHLMPAVADQRGYQSDDAADMTLHADVIRAAGTRSSFRMIDRREQPGNQSRGLKRGCDLMQPHEVRHLLHLLLLLPGEARDERRGRPIEPLDTIVIEAEIAALLSLHDLAELA